MKPVSISFIGAGNLAWHLAPALDNVGYAVKEVYSRKEQNAALLSERLYQSRVVTELDFSQSTAEVFIIAVSDDAIPEVLSKLILPSDAILVHTSGSQPLEVLGDFVTPNTGVFYPLQTFTRKRPVDFSVVPFFVEGAEPSVEKTLMSMAKALSKKVVRATSDDRRVLHAAAVFASNFTNHMLTIAKGIMTSNKLSYDLLKPLIAETLNKSLEIGPEKAQTGPAKRGDLETLDKHMELLKDTPEVAEIYRIISQHIVDSYN